MQIPYFNTRERIFRLGKYQVVSLSCFVSNLLLMYGLIYFLAWPVWLANGLAYGLAVNVSYLCHYHWTFRGTPRGKLPGFGYFAMMAVCAMTTIVIGVEILNGHFGLPLLVARVAMGAMVGVVSFLFNNFITFLAD